MTDVTEHHGEEKGESHNCEEPRVDFPVPGYAVGVHNLLKRCGDIIELEVGGWWLIAWGLRRLQLAKMHPGLRAFVQAPQCCFNDVTFSRRNP